MMQYVSPFLRVRLQWAFLARLSLPVLLIISIASQNAAAQNTSGWVDDGQAVRLENPIDRVGIGTANPRRKLHVGGDAPKNADDGQLEITGRTLTTMGIVDKSMLLGRAASYGFVQSHNSEPLALNPGGNNVGIGTAAPEARLHVRGGQNNQWGMILSSAGGSAYGLKISHGWHGHSHVPIFQANAWDGSTEVARFGIYANGNLGVGTTTPAAKLDVRGTGPGLSGVALRTDNNHASGIGLWSSTHSNDANVVITNTGTGDLIRGFSGPGGSNLPFRVLNNGTTVTTVLQITGGGDLSEKFEVNTAPDAGVETSEQIQPGTIVSIDPDNPGKLVVAGKAYDRRVAGIISGAGGLKPGMLLSQSGSVADGPQPVALAGRVYCWADASNGPIEPGDLLTTAATPGHAMRVDEVAKAQGAIIGKAMTALKSGRGLVLAIVSLQ